MSVDNSCNKLKSSSSSTTNTQQLELSKSGWLFKWTNYLKGYRRRWFVLKDSQLCYYRAENNGVGVVPTLSIRRRRRFNYKQQGSQAEMAHCRGSISLHGALIYTVDTCTFVITNGGTQTFHIKATSEVERQSWVTVLELAKTKAIRKSESEEDDEESGDFTGTSEDWSLMIEKLKQNLNDLQQRDDVVEKKCKALVKLLSDLESNENLDDLTIKRKEILENSRLYRIATNSMIQLCNEYLKTAQKHGNKWIKLLQHEREQKNRLQELVETLAEQHSKLEKAASAHSNQGPQVNTNSDVDEEDENEFYDAIAESGGVGGCGGCFTTTNNNNYNNNDIISGNNSGVSGGVIRDLKIVANNNSNKTNITTTTTTSTTETTKTGAPSHFTLNLKLPSDQYRNNSDSSSDTEDNNVKQHQHETKHVVVLTGGGGGGNNNNNNNINNNNNSINSLIKEQQTKFENQLLMDNVKSSLPVKIRRTRVPDKPNYPLNLWSIMKNCIGKDLSKIPMPVNFSEPLSMLQRLTEDYEYAEVLDKAALCNDPCEQLAYVAAFTISSYSTTSSRTGKPFNPLLGETYECDRFDDLGWRCINEQVSHHPPMVAQYCEGKEWKCWQEFTMTTKFRGKFLQVIPLGTAHVQFNKNGNHYTWRKVTTTVHNIIVGKLWVDQHGDMEIIGMGSTSGIKCHLKYIPYSYFTRDQQRRVKGLVMDETDNVKWIINGTWDNSVEISPVIGGNTGTSSNPIYQTGQSIIAWKRRMPSIDAEKYYNFTILACQLNEYENGIAPTDSRLRPDQRLMENGQWDDANAEKVRLEEKQRLVRRQREADAEKAATDGRPYEHYKPLWFEQRRDEDSDSIIHVYKGNYWECKEKQDWSKCPNIF